MIPNFEVNLISKFDVKLTSRIISFRVNFDVKLISNFDVKLTSRIDLNLTWKFQKKNISIKSKLDIKLKSKFDIKLTSKLSQNLTSSDLCQNLMSIWCQFDLFRSIWLKSCQIDVNLTSMCYQGYISIIFFYIFGILIGIQIHSRERSVDRKQIISAWYVNFPIRCRFSIVIVLMSNAWILNLWKYTILLLVNANQGMVYTFRNFLSISTQF